MFVVTCCKPSPYYASPFLEGGAGRLLGGGGGGGGGGGEAREAFLGRTGTEASRAASGSGSWGVEWALAQTSVYSLLLELLAGRPCGWVCTHMHVKQGTDLQHYTQNQQQFKISHIKACVFI